jgi:protein-tyrosine phosphatase
MKQLLMIGALMTGILVAAPSHADGPKKVAFVDTGNTGRSVSAEALAEKIIEKQKLPIVVISRAVDLNPFNIKPEANAATILKKRGIDVSQHRAAQITDNDVRHADIILTMTEAHKAKLVALFPDAKDKVFTLSAYATGDYAEIADAYGKPMPVYVAMIGDLDKFVPLALAKIAAQ